MNDENPYRFVPEDETATDDSPDVWMGSYRRPESGSVLSPREIRRLAYESEYLVAALLVYVCVILSFMLIDAIERAAGTAARGAREASGRPIPGPELERDVRFAQATSKFGPAILFAGLHAGLAILAYRIGALTTRSSGAATAIACLTFVPCIDVAVVFYLFREARLALRRHGIRTSFRGTNKEMLPDGRAW